MTSGFRYWLQDLIFRDDVDFAQMILTNLIYTKGTDRFVKANVSFQNAFVRFSKCDDNGKSDANAPGLFLTDVEYTNWGSMKRIFETAVKTRSFSSENNLKAIEEEGYTLDGSQSQHENKELIFVRAKADSKPIHFFVCAENPEENVFGCFEKAKPKLWVR